MLFLSIAEGGCRLSKLVDSPILLPACGDHMPQKYMWERERGLIYRPKLSALMNAWSCCGFFPSCENLV